MSPLPMQVKCAACGAPIEGASVWDRGQVMHPWCYATQERAKDHPALQYIAADLAKRERDER